MTGDDAYVGFEEKKTEKLRHAEYYDLQETFDRLYAQSKYGKTLNNLMEIISSEENIKLAYRNVKSNKGSSTAGVDKLNIKDLAKISESEFVKKSQQTGMVQTKGSETS